MKMSDENSLISTGSELGPHTLPGHLSPRLLLHIPFFMAIFFHLAKIQTLLSAVRPHSQLGQLFGLVPKFLQWWQNSIQMKKLISALFANPPISVAEPSLDTEYQEDNFFIGV